MVEENLLILSLRHQLEILKYPPAYPKEYNSSSRVALLEAKKTKCLQLESERDTTGRQVTLLS